MDKSIVFKRRLLPNLMMVGFLPTYINLFDMKFNQVYTPNLPPLIVVVFIIMLLMLLILFNQKIIITHEGIDNRLSSFKNQFIRWQDIAYIAGLKETNKVVNELTFFDHLNQEIGKVNIYEIANYSQFVRLVRDKVKDDRTAAMPLKNEKQEKLLTAWSNRVLQLLMISLLVLLGLKLQVNFVHIPFGYESTIYYGYGTFFWLFLAILTIIAIINRKKPFMNEYFQLALLSVFLLIVTIKVLTTSLSLYHENLIKNNQLPVITLNTQLSGRPNSQYWEILTNNKPAVKFDLKDWQGMNQKLISPDFDVNYDKKPSYQLQAYQGKFGYYVITPEQFANAQPIK